MLFKYAWVFVCVCMFVSVCVCVRVACCCLHASSELHEWRQHTKQLGSSCVLSISFPLCLFVHSIHFLLLSVVSASWYILWTTCVVRTNAQFHHVCLYPWRTFVFLESLFYLSWCCCSFSLPLHTIRVYNSHEMFVCEWRKKKYRRLETNCVFVWFAHMRECMWFWMLSRHIHSCSRLCVE